METVITGTNAITFPHLQIWDWRVALYLFLGGLAAGLAVMASILHLRKEGELAQGEASRYVAPLIVPVILSIGMLFIFLDLERKLNVYWIYLTLQPLSPMSWGSWALLAFFPLSVAFILATIPEEELCRVLMHRICPLAHWLQGYHRVITIITFCMGIFIGVYTGVLLSSFVARPLWNSAMLPALFLTSALSSGAALMIIVARRKAVKLFFTKVDVILIAAEILILCLFFYGQYTSSAAHRASILPFFSLNQEFFWYGASIILLGIVLPGALVMKLMEVTEGHGDELSSSAVLTMNLSALLVIAGGLIIRLAFVYAGQLSAFS